MRSQHEAEWYREQVSVLLPAKYADHPTGQNWSAAYRDPMFSSLSKEDRNLIIVRPYTGPRDRSPRCWRNHLWDGEVRKEFRRRFTDEEKEGLKRCILAGHDPDAYIRYLPEPVRELKRTAPGPAGSATLQVGDDGAGPSTAHRSKRTRKDDGEVAAVDALLGGPAVNTLVQEDANVGLDDDIVSPSRAVGDDEGQLDIPDEAPFVVPEGTPAADMPEGGSVTTDDVSTEDPA